MVKIKIAELCVEIDNRYPFLESFCREFAADFEKADISVRVSDEALAAERAANTLGSSDGYLESVCAYRAIAEELPRFGAFVFHASVVALDGQAYAFAAHSGTGKSTHTGLWLEEFGARAVIVNGDKPILRRTDKGFVAYGTPWRGKERRGGNLSAPLAAICFLARGEKNSIAPLDDENAVMRIFDQVVLPKSPAGVAKALELLDALFAAVPIYELHCNISREAAQVAWAGMCKGENNEEK